MANRWLVPFLVAMMLFTGVCNTLLSKYQDLQCVANCDSPNPNDIKRFSQPVLQTVQMFIGEMGCWLVIGGYELYRRFKGAKPSPLLSGGYSRVDTDDHDQDGSDDEDEEEQNPNFSSLDPHNAAVKSMLPKPAENLAGRLPLKGWKVIMLAMPACCDIIGTTFMNAGLLFVAASIYQMTRGALVLFVGLFSVVFLKRKLLLYQWSALVIVVLGVAIVGLAGAIAPDPQAQPDPRAPTSQLQQLRQEDPIAPLLFIRAAYDRVKTTQVSHDTLLAIAGVAMIALAQIFTATQFVLEEYILEKYELEPLKVVGWEGVFGFIVTVIVMLILHAAVGRTPQGRSGYFDMVEGWRQIFHDRVIGVTSILIMISIGGFNFFGLSVTRSVSATARSTIDTCRTLFIWIVSLGLRWETFKWLQIVGFMLLVYGTFLFNDIVRPPLQVCVQRKEEVVEEEEGRTHGE